MNLGSKVKKPEGAATPSQMEMPDVTYPGFSLNDEKAVLFAKHFPADIGDTIHVGAKLKLTGVRNDQYGNSLTFDVISMHKHAGKDEGDENSEESDAEMASNPAIARVMRKRMAK